MGNESGFDWGWEQWRKLKCLNSTYTLEAQLWGNENRLILEGKKEPWLSLSYFDKANQ